MKKLIIFVSIFVCLLSLASCSDKSDDAIININEVSGLVTEKGYTEEDFQEDLLGKYRDDIITVWGEPDGMLSGLWGDIWYLSDNSNKQIILYYDRDGIVEDIIIAER